MCVCVCALAYICAVMCTCVCAPGDGVMTFVCVSVCVCPCILVCNPFILTVAVLSGDRRKRQRINASQWMGLSTTQSRLLTTGQYWSFFAVMLNILYG